MHRPSVEIVKKMTDVNLIQSPSGAGTLRVFLWWRFFGTLNGAVAK